MNKPLDSCFRLCYNNVTNSNIGRDKYGSYNSWTADTQQPDDLSAAKPDRQRTESHVQQQYGEHTGGIKEAP